MAVISRIRQRWQMLPETTTEELEQWRHGVVVKCSNRLPLTLTGPIHEPHR
jgi:hypothetical protein